MCSAGTESEQPSLKSLSVGPGSIQLNGQLQIPNLVSQKITCVQTPLILVGDIFAVGILSYNYINVIIWQHLGHECDTNYKKRNLPIKIS